MPALTLARLGWYFGLSPADLLDLPVTVVQMMAACLDLDLEPDRP